ncbi:hypothetical protein TNCT_185771 [Trichonephila clavata]|uniref:Uncharacterized protein n=1 Tax=Trichonephila clavata TaxID=2740835 RepID=A0A8X6HXA2_TRICU|nr:hypothetical protein TNCT_185771 [Trichonephila clavata]
MRNERSACLPPRPHETGVHGKPRWSHNTLGHEMASIRSLSCAQKLSYVGFGVPPILQPNTLKEGPVNPNTIWWQGQFRNITAE